MLREVPAADGGQGYHSRYQRDDRRHQQDAVQAGGEGGPGDHAHGRPGLLGQPGDHVPDLPRLHRRGDPRAAAGQSGHGGHPGQHLLLHVVREQRPQQGDAGGDPDLAEGGVDARGHAGPLRWHHADGGGGQRRIDDADADAAHDHARDEMGPGRARVEPAHEQQSRADDDQARPDEQPDRHPRGQPARHGGGDQDAAGDHHQPHAGSQRRVAENVLQVQHEIEQHREDRGAEPERRDRAAAEGRQLEQQHVEHRLRTAQFHQDEDGQQHGRQGEAAEDQAVGEGPLVRLDEPVDQARQRHREEREAGPVGPAGPRRARLGHLGQRDDDGREADRRVHEEDPAPGEAGGQQPAEQRPDGHCQAGHRSPHAERDAAVLAAEGVRQQRQRYREHDRPADSLQGAGQLQHHRADGKTAQDRREGENGQAGQVQPATAEHVGQAARRQQERRQGQRIGVDDPLQVGEARIQRPLDIRQGHVHDRDVQQQHEGAQAHRDQGPPFAAALARILAQSFGGESSRWSGDRPARRTGRRFLHRFLTGAALTERSRRRPGPENKNPGHRHALANIASAAARVRSNCQLCYPSRLLAELRGWLVIGLGDDVCGFRLFPPPGFAA